MSSSPAARRITSEISAKLRGAEGLVCRDGPGVRRDGDRDGSLWGGGGESKHQLPKNRPFHHWPCAG